MRNLKKLLAVIVTIAMLATFAIPAFAAEGLSADTQTCSDIGMLIGTGSDGVTADYAVTVPTRIQSAVMFLRLKGLYNEAAAYTGTENFADAASAEWATPLMAYLKANPSLGWVGDGVNFMPQDILTAQQYYKVLLSALGYATPADYEYADTLTFAATAGLAVAGNVTPFDINAVAVATVEALKANVKGGTTTLAATLVAGGTVDEAAYIAAGLYSEKINAAIVGASKLTVTFGSAVDTTKASFEVKSGSFIVPVNVTWDADKKVATLTKTFGKFAAGTYTVTEKGLTYSGTGNNVALLTLEAEKVAKIEITSDLVKTTGVGTATADYKVYNQYNEDVTAAYTVNGVSSYGTVGASATGTVTVNKGSAWATTDPTSGSLTLYIGAVTATKTVNLVSAKATDTFTLGAAVLPTTVPATVRFADDMTDVKVEYSAVDQYGNAVYPTTTTGLTFVYGSGIVAASATFSDDPADAGSKTILTVDLAEVAVQTNATLTVIVNATGKVSSTSIALYPVAKIADYTLTPDSKVIKAGTAYKVWVDAVDTYGTALTGTVIAGADAQFSIVSLSGVATVTGTIEYDSVKQKAYFAVTPVTAGSSTNVVVTLLATGKASTLPIAVNDASAIAGMTLEASALYYAAGGSTVFSATFVDQYGEAVVADAAYDIDITTSNAAVVAEQLNLTVAGMINPLGATIAPIGAAGTSATLTVTLNKGATVVDQKTVAVSVIPTATTLTYTVADIAKLKGVAAQAADYDATVVVTALDAAGHTVYIPAGAIVSITSANTDLVVVNGSEVWGDITGIAAPATEASTTITVIVENYDGTITIANKTVTVSAVPSAAASLDYVTVAAPNTSVAGDIAGANLALYKFLEKDQYGVAITTYTDIYTNNTTGETFDVIAGVVTKTSAGTPAVGTSVNITVITANGLLKTIKVVY